MHVYSMYIGAPQVSNENIQNLSWYESGLQYMLLGNDYNFEIEEMIDMAKAIMDTQVES